MNNSEDKNIQEPQAQEPQVVDAKVLDEFKQDLFKMKRIASSKDEEIQKLQEQLKQNEVSAKVKNEEYKSLYEDTTKEVDAWKEKYTGLQSALVEDKKFSAIERIATEKGLRKEALEDLRMLDTDGVIVETTSHTGKIQVVGADRFVDQLKESKGHWFTDAMAPNINNANSQYSAGAKKMYSPSELLGLQKENPAEYEKAIKENRIKR